MRPALKTARGPTPEGRQDPLSDLLDEALEPDPRALRRLVDEVAPDVVQVIAGIMGRQAPDLDDLTQEALLGFVRALPDFRRECRVRRFARRVAARTAVVARRRARRKATCREDYIHRTQPLATEEPNPGELSIRDHRRQLLLDLLADLPPEQSETLVLRAVLGHALKEVAELTGVPINTVRSRIRLAKEAMRQRIASDRAYSELLELGRGKR